MLVKTRTGIQLGAFVTTKTAYRVFLLFWRLECEFRGNPAGDSDLIPATVPI